MVMLMYILIKYINGYTKTSRSLWQYYRDDPALSSNNNIDDFLADKNNDILLKFKQQITGQLL